MIDLKGKNALITGSSRGVGQQIAKGLAGLGCNIIIHGRTESNCSDTLQLLNSFDVKIDVVSGDLGEEKSVQKVIQQVKDLNIPIDILYNNAAIMTDYREDFWSHTRDDWMRSMAVNVFSVYDMCAAFIPAMIERKFGRVVNLISGIKDQPELMPYAASKYAVDKLTKDLAVKTEHTGVRINSLDPGWLRTDLGGEFADNPVEAVLPAALLPARIEDDGPNGIYFSGA